MKIIDSIILAAMAILAGESSAATRILQGYSIIAGKDVIVGNKIYDVDFGFKPTMGWFAPTPEYPGPASVFSTRDEAAEALNAIYTQLIGNGAVYPNAFALVSIGVSFGFPERKPFGVVQLYGDMLAEGHAKAVYADFVTEVLFSSQGHEYGTKAEMNAVKDFGTTVIPTSPLEGYTYPVWTFKGVVPAVPEPSMYWLTGLGLLVVGLNRAKMRGIAV